jgi:hypothetical protein
MSHRQDPKKLTIPLGNDNGGNMPYLASLANPIAETKLKNLLNACDLPSTYAPATLPDVDLHAAIPAAFSDAFQAIHRRMSQPQNANLIPPPMPYVPAAMPVVDGTLAMRIPDSPPRRDISHEASAAVQHTGGVFARPETSIVDPSRPYDRQKRR